MTSKYSFALGQDPEEVRNRLHKNPEISFSCYGPSTCAEEYEHLLRIPDSGVINCAETYKIVAGSYDGPMCKLFIRNVYFVKNKQRVYPKWFSLTYKGVNILYCGDCMDDFLNKHTVLFDSPLFFDSDISITYVPHDTDVKAYVEILSVPGVEFKDAVRFRIHAPMICCHEDISERICHSIISLKDEHQYCINITGNYYLHKLYLFCDSSRVSNVSLYTNNRTFVLDADPELLNARPPFDCKRYMVFCLGVKSGVHGFWLKSDDVLTLSFTVSNPDEYFDWACVIEKRCVFRMY